MVADISRWWRKNAFLLLVMGSLFVGAADAWCQIANRRRLSRPCLDITNTEDQNGSEENNYYTLPRLYVGAAAKLGDGVHFTLSPDQAHYVTKVMRIGKKRSRDSVRVFDGVHGEWLAQIQVDEEEDGQRKKRRRHDVTIMARCTHQLRPQQDTISDSLAEPWLFFAPIKKQRVKIMLEKCTELGVGRFVPILTERADPSSVRDVTRDLEKLTAQTVEASEQCERLTVPPLSICISDGKAEDPWDLPMLLKEWSSNEAFRDKHLLICRERTASGSVPVLNMLENLCTGDTSTVIAFVVGSEGGWSLLEEALCDEYASSCDNIHCVSLGSLVLRAETAAIASITAYMLCRNLYSRNDKITDDS